jgi:hypothetical protein
MKDKREFLRLSEIWDLNYKIIELEDIKKSSINSLTVDISGGGVRFEANKKIPEGTMLLLELKSKHFPSPIIAVAKSVWCKKAKKKDKFEVGLQFWWTGWKDNDSQDAVSEHIVKSLLDLANKEITPKSQKSKSKTSRAQTKPDK